MVHDARSIANEMIRRAHEAGREITHLQVQKLVYYCHAWMLGVYGRPLIEQDVVAWRYGPVVREVWDSLRHNSDKPIALTIPNVPRAELDENDEHIVRQVSEQYGHFTGLQLSASTHAAGTPWHTVREKWGQDSYIPDFLIRDYYKRRWENSPAGDENA